MFTHLHNHSHYSLLDGLPKINELVGRTKELGMDSIALTDHGVMYGIVEFYKKAKEEGIKPIVGMEAYISPSGRAARKMSPNERNNHLILLAENEEGYRNLVKLASAAHLEGFYYKPRIDHELLEKHGKGLICLSACLAGEIAQSIIRKNPQKTEELIKRYQSYFGDDNFFLELQQHPNIPEQKIVNEALIRLAREHSLPLVATQDAHYIMPEDAEAQDILVAVQTGKTVNDEKRLSMAHEDFSLKSAEAMRESFKDIPEAIENTRRIAERVNLKLTLGETILPHYRVPEGETVNSYLEKLARQGLKKRYPRGVTEEIKKRLRYELSIIQKTGYASYFLIVQDFVNWAKDNKIVVGPGRGSAAGSLVSYLTGITSIDPIKYNLLFERFLNPERIGMPDIDLDFADLRRDEVIDYVAQKYGRDHVAQIITFGTMAARAAIRDAGRALGFSYGFCDQLAKVVPFGKSLTEALELSPDLKESYQNDSDAKRLVDAAKKLEGVARHASTHACGVVITKDPLENYLPLQYSSQGGKKTIVSQYPMKPIEDLGLLKMDFLGLGNLTIIENTLNFIKARTGETIDIEDLPLDDSKTFHLFREAKTIGIFQLESQGMRRYLKDLKPTTLEDIIVMVSLYRPGPLDAGMVEEYIERKHGRKEVTYLHPELEPILKNTYGIIVYQEQLMQVAQKLAGFSLSEADILRKAVGKKIKKLLDEQREKTIGGMVNHGINRETASEIWHFIEPFARYGFNRSHAACYATIAYQTAYLKAKYPLEFMTALMNAHENDTEKIAFLIEECKNMDIRVLPPNINESEESFTPKKNSNEKVLHFGLVAIKNVGQNVVEAIVKERKAKGQFTSIDNFTKRLAPSDMNRKSWESLIKAGALDTLAERNELLENLDNILSFSREHKKSQEQGQYSLFGENESPLSSLRMKETTPVPQKEKLAWEKELLGLYISDHPLGEYKEALEKNYNLIKTLTENQSLRTASVGGAVNKVQKITTRQGKPMAFVEIEDISGSVELVIFPSLMEGKKNLSPFLEEGRIIAASGRVDRKDQKPKLLAEDIDYFRQEGINKNNFTPESSKPSAPESPNLTPNPQKSLKLVLPQNSNKDALLKIKEKLKVSPRGDYSVSISFKKNGSPPIKTSFAVAITPFLLQELESIVGKKGVVIEEQS